MRELRRLHKEKSSLKCIGLNSRAIEWKKSYDHSYDINVIVIEGNDHWSEFMHKVEGQIENLTGSVSQLMERLTYDREYGIGESGSGYRIHC